MDTNVLLQEMTDILAERRGADARAAEDAGVGTTDFMADVTGASLTRPWYNGQRVKAAAPPPATVAVAAVVVAAEEVDGKVRVRIVQEDHPLYGEVIDWPASLVQPAFPKLEGIVRVLRTFEALDPAAKEAFFAMVMNKSESVGAEAMRQMKKQLLPVATQSCEELAVEIMAMADSQ